MGDLLRFPAQLRRVPDDLAERQQNMAIAMQLGLIPVRPAAGYVPLLGRLNDETKMQLEDGE
jgi:hypothetical protein